MAKKYLQNENLYILVVGDGATNRQKLEKLGYGIVGLNENGEAINNKKIVEAGT